MAKKIKNVGEKKVNWPYPQLMAKKSPLLPRESTDWATEAFPNRIRINVPEIVRNYLSRSVPKQCKCSQTG